MAITIKFVVFISFLSLVKSISQQDFTSTLLKNIEIQWKISDTHCSLHFVNFRHQSDHTTGLTLNWSQVSEFGEPYKNTKIIASSTFNDTNRGHGKFTQKQTNRFKNSCAIIAILFNDTPFPNIHDGMLKLGDPNIDHFIFVASNDTASNTDFQKSILQIVKSKYIMVITPKQIWYLLEPIVYTGRLTPSTSLTLHKNANNLIGRIINVTFPDIPPYVIPEGPNKYVGSLDNMLKEISKLSNVTFNILYIPKLGSGRHLENGTWTGAMGVVEKGSAEIIALMGVSLSRTALIDYSTETTREAMIFCLLEPEAVLHWNALFLPLSLPVWGLTFLMFVMVAILMYIYEVKAHMIQVHDGGIHEWIENICETILVPLGMFLEQTFPITVSKNMLALLWLLCSLIIGTSYKTNLVGFLTLPSKPIFPKTFKDLNEHKDYVVNQHSIGGIERELWDSPRTTVTKALSKRINYVASLEKCLKSAANSNKVVCIGWKNVLRAGMYRFLNSKDKSSDSLYITQDSLTSAIGSIATKKGSPYFDVFNRYAGYLISANLIQKWNNYFIERSPLTGSTLDDNSEFIVNNNEDGKAKPLRLNNIFAVFWVLIVGLSLATLGYMGELIIYRLSDK